MRRYTFIWLLPAVFFLSWSVFESPAVTAYLEGVKEKDRKVMAREDLLTHIKEEAKRRYEPPIDARVDRVWKAIPGYNGKAVDIEATYQAAKKRGANKRIPWIYKEVPAKVSLGDLGPHPIYRGNEKKPMAGLMINVAWGTEHIPEMLRILKQENVTATFFLDGSWVEKNPEMARRLLESGHEIGNHAYSHPQMSRLSRAQIREEITKTEAAIQKLAPVRSRFFAPPSGDFNQAVVEEADRLGMKTVLWTADTVDWKESMMPTDMIARIQPELSNGTLILMHPTDRTVKALPEIIRLIKKKGLKAGKVSEVLSSKRVESVEPGSPF